MVRDEPLDWPDADEVATAAERALCRPVADATPIEEGLNATYRLELAGGPSAVLKAATLATDDELRPEPHLAAHLGRETAVPTPEVLAAVGPRESALGVAFFVSRYCEGRHETDVLALAPDAHERLVREVGRYLAQLHDLDVADGFGNLRIEDGGDPTTATDPEFVVVSRRESWPAWFAELASETVAGLVGEGLLNDDDPRFADLESVVRDALATFPPGDAAYTVDPVVLHGDLRPANLVFAPDDADQIVRAVLDFGDCQTGDGLLDLALAEDSLVDVPLGGTDRADRLRRSLRDTYLTHRDAELTDPFDVVYSTYRLYARARSLAAFGFWAQFAREDDRDEVARRWRRFVRDRLAEVG